MGRKIIDKNLKKINFTIRLPNWLVQEIKANEGYTKLVTDVLIITFSKKEIP
jgi:hypothetical protein